jgi:hypothetical protein
MFLVLCVLLFAPLIPRNTDNPELLAAYANDEPFLTMALEATLVRPYGNPGAYFDPLRDASSEIPQRWGEKRYAWITYYGGAMFELAFPFYAIARALGLPPFPTGPIVLRTLTLLAGLLALLVLYNIGRERGSRVAGLLAAAYLATDSFFLYYANFIHPDTLQLLFGLFAFVLAVAHARNRTTATLVGLGLACGLVHGSKAGGAWTIPMVLVALWLGAEPGSRRLVRRLLVVGLAALVGFFVSTPYAFLDRYYARSMRLAFETVTTDSLRQGRLSFSSWLDAVFDYAGPLATALVLFTLARAVWVNRRGIVDEALLLAVVLSASQLLWYGAAGRLWLVPGYLLLSFGLIGLFAFETLVRGVGRGVAELRRRGLSASTGRLVWMACVTLIAVGLVSARWYTPASWALDQYATSRSTVRAANEWAVERRLPSRAVILHDDLAYFDPARFPAARLHGGVLTWNDVGNLEPDYVVLSSSLFGADWMQNLIKSQRERRRDNDPFNVRVYQDLLPAAVPGPTGVPGVQLVGVIRARETSRTPAGHLESAVRRARALLRSGDEPLVGPELRIFRLRPGFTVPPDA